jgi:hypothetical protein
MMAATRSATEGNEALAARGGKTPDPFAHGVPGTLVTAGGGDNGSVVWAVRETITEVEGATTRATRRTPASAILIKPEARAATPFTKAEAVAIMEPAAREDRVVVETAARVRTTRPMPPQPA